MLQEAIDEQRFGLPDYGTWSTNRNRSLYDTACKLKSGFVSWGISQNLTANQRRIVIINVRRCSCCRAAEETKQLSAICCVRPYS